MDDFELQNLNEAQQTAVYQLIAERYEKSSKELLRWDQKLPDTPWLNEFKHFRQKKTESEALIKKLQIAIPIERKDILLGHLRQLASGILGLPPDQQMSGAVGFFEKGMDSIMAVEFRNQLQMDLGPTSMLQATLIFDHPNLIALSDYLERLLFPEIEQKVEEKVIPFPQEELKAPETMQDEEIARMIENEFNNLR